jgi:LysM repeat protein
MRYILACISVAALFTVTACGDRRQNMAIVPDRQGHAYGADGQVQNTSTAPVANVGEGYHTLVAGETLSQVAKKYNVDLGWLIKRNDIQKPSDVTAGKNLIVPNTPVAPALPQDANQQALQDAPAQAAPARPAPAPKKSTKR